jgi:hypothetical protein
VLRLLYAVSLAVVVDSLPLHARETVSVYGLGTSSCAKAMQPIVRDEAFAWVMGYITGKNSEKFLVSPMTDGYGFFGEVELLCKEKPSTTLFHAAEITYERLARPR